MTKIWLDVGVRALAPFLACLTLACDPPFGTGDQPSAARNDLDGGAIVWVAPGTRRITGTVVARDGSGDLIPGVSRTLTTEVASNPEITAAGKHYFAAWLQEGAVHGGYYSSTDLTSPSGSVQRITPLKGGVVRYDLFYSPPSDQVIVASATEDTLDVSSVRHDPSSDGSAAVTALLRLDEEPYTLTVASSTRKDGVSLVAWVTTKEVVYPGVRVFRSPTCDVKYVLISPDGSVLNDGGVTRDCDAILSVASAYDPIENRFLLVLQTHRWTYALGSLYAVGINPDGSQTESRVVAEGPLGVVPEDDVAPGSYYGTYYDLYSNFRALENLSATGTASGSRFRVAFWEVFTIQKLVVGDTWVESEYGSQQLRTLELDALGTPIGVSESGGVSVDRPRCVPFDEVRRCLTADAALDRAMLADDILVSEDGRFLSAEMVP